jgi:hypothetical protein
MVMTIHAGDCLSGCGICTDNYHAGREGAGSCGECGVEL